MDKKEIRAVFSKTDRAVYMSHLDLLRTMQRALKRAKIPVWYSEGFNPKIYLSFPLALSLGAAGRAEAMDFYITEDMSFEDNAGRMNAALPDGLHISRVYYPEDKAKDIAAAEYIIRIQSDGNTAELFREYAAGDTVYIKKHSKKKGAVTVDIKPFSEIISAADTGGAAEIYCRLPAGNEMNINAGALADSFVEYCAEKGISAECVYIERTKILCADKKEFV